MKKLIALLMAMVMMLSMAACGGAGESDGDQGGNANMDLATKYGIDMEAEGEQKLSDERASMEKLKDTRDVWLKRQISFSLDPDPKSYEDFVEYIGCDASFYKYNAKNGQRTFTWVSDSDENAKLVAIFWDKGDGYVLYAASAPGVR